VDFNAVLPDKKVIFGLGPGKADDIWIAVSSTLAGKHSWRTEENVMEKQVSARRRILLYIP
jgi:hypothetical protein